MLVETLFRVVVVVLPPEPDALAVDLLLGLVQLLLGHQTVMVRLHVVMLEHMEDVIILSRVIQEK